MSDEQESSDNVDMRLAKIKQTGALPPVFKPNPEYVLASEITERRMTENEQEYQRRVFLSGTKASEAPATGNK